MALPAPGTEREQEKGPGVRPEGARRLPANALAEWNEGHILAESTEKFECNRSVKGESCYEK
jgi:hypothetical protein